MEVQEESVTSLKPYTNEECVDIFMATQKKKRKRKSLSAPSFLNLHLHN